MGTTLKNSNTEYIVKKSEKINCMFCKQNDYFLHEIFGNKNQYRYVECRNCQNIYLNPRPVYDEEFTEIA